MFSLKIKIEKNSDPYLFPSNCFLLTIGRITKLSSYLNSEVGSLWF